ncbi:hypothetical protein PV08_02409 [Exophiala spinifera]|uniref:BZIP domain-containing protein n=1 Tax=Exophiala spinifera TaxID=91928 RepID=A0A0D1YSA9_9EURO|nr:uncharacterized protein PV08_02409 [Exophiala spinifera]KIW18121.1 hypothetical protein PV08_02409 [Exophiala spinifera]
MQTQAQPQRVTAMGTKDNTNLLEQPYSSQPVRQSWGASASAAFWSNFDHSTSALVEWEHSTHSGQASTSSSSSSTHKDVPTSDSFHRTCQSPHDDGMASPAIDLQLRGLDQTYEANSGEFDMFMIDEMYPDKPNASSSVWPISTIASKNERRKAQNRAAQRAFRFRQQQALHDATARLHALEAELKEVHGKKQHYQQLFESLTVEYEKLLDRFEHSVGSTKSSKRS